MVSRTLDDWLRWQESLHPSEIELGLERVSAVFQRLHPEPPPFTVITVAGTNGKGSSVAMLESILVTAGYRVGTYTSPHLIEYNERVRLSGQAVADALLIKAFERIDAARADTSLTYFEFGTLAALDIFYRQPLDVVILEVGLGGRLDAVNIVDADVALITSISLDHTDWLGEDIEAIAAEKAGIMRADKAAVFSGTDIPQAICQRAEALQVPLYVAGKDYRFAAGNGPDGWQWHRKDRPPVSLPMPGLSGLHQVQNAAGVMMVLQLLAETLPVSRPALHQGLREVSLAGRFQIRPGDPVLILDVAHNPDATARLAEQLARQPVSGRTLAVVGMLQDKDAAAALGKLTDSVDAWFTASLPTPRSQSGEKLRQVIEALGATNRVRVCENVPRALAAARDAAGPGDRIVLFGSFYTVAQGLADTV